MKNHLIALALGMAPLVHADLSPTEIFESLAPQAAPPSATIAPPTLASIPRDASFVLSLPHIPKSIAQLQAIFVQGGDSLPASFVQAGSKVHSLSLGIGKGGTSALLDLVRILSHLQDSYLRLGEEFANSDNQELKSIRERELAVEKELKAKASQELQALKLPSIYLVAEVDSELIQGLTMFNHTIEPLLQQSSEHKMKLYNDIYLTGAKAIEHKGMKGYQFELDVYGVKKSYCLLQQITGNKVSLIGTSDVAELKLVSSEQDSFLSSDVGRSLAADQDAHLYSAATDTIGRITRLIDTERYLDKEINCMNTQLMLALYEIAPHSLHGLRASLRLAGNPELQVTWQDDKYQFAPKVFKGVNLINKDADRVHYFESSSFNVPYAPVASLLELSGKYSSATQVYYNKLIDSMNKENQVTTSENQAQLQQLRRKEEEMKTAARQLGLSTATGEVCLFEQTPDMKDLMVIGFKDKAIMQSAIKQYQAAQNDYREGVDALSEVKLSEGTQALLRQGTQLHDAIRFVPNALILSKNTSRSEQYAKAEGGPTVAGALAMAGKRSIMYYARLDKVGENVTVKLQMRFRKKK